MDPPRICAVITNLETESETKTRDGADLFEIRIDMIGKGWERIAQSLNKPWIATNRLKSEGGFWEGNENERRAELLKALSIGADMIDIELASPNLEEMVSIIKRTARCIISHHDTHHTPSLAEMRRIINDELSAGADICKLVTTARIFDDNVSVLSMINEFKPAETVAFCMGPNGQISRILCPLSGGVFTYATSAEGQSSASGQLTIVQMRDIFGVFQK